jgi:hypothetical protein
MKAIRGKSRFCQLAIYSTFRSLVVDYPRGCIVIKGMVEVDLPPTESQTSQEKESEGIHTERYIVLDMHPRTLRGNNSNFRTILSVNV